MKTMNLTSGSCLILCHRYHCFAFQAKLQYLFHTSFSNKLCESILSNLWTSTNTLTCTASIKKRSHCKCWKRPVTCHRCCFGAVCSLFILPDIKKWCSAQTLGLWSAISGIEDPLTVTCKMTNFSKPKGTTSGAP